MGTKAEWITYAANIDGEWGLCANCESSAAAKKLFRQYNINRNFMGLDRVSSPLDNTALSLSQDFDLDYFTGPGLGGPAIVLIGDFIFPPGTAAILSCGRGLKNAWWALDQAQMGNDMTSGTGFDFVALALTQLGQNLAATSSNAYSGQVCWTDANGAPGFPGTFNLGFTYIP